MFTGSSHLASGAVTNDGDVEKGGEDDDDGDNGQLMLAVYGAVGAGHLASDAVTNDGDVERGGEDDDDGDNEQLMLAVNVAAGTASVDLLVLSRFIYVKWRRRISHHLQKV